MSASYETQATTATSATASEIRAILGPVEDDITAKVLDIGATGAEVLEAYTWLRADDRLQRQTEHELHGRAARVFDILQAGLPDIEEDKS